MSCEGAGHGGRDHAHQDKKIIYDKIKAISKIKHMCIDPPEETSGLDHASKCTT